jgi:prefoldin subunit 5
MQVNPRGIPQAPFIENIHSYGKDAEATLKQFNETLLSFQRMESGVQQRKQNLGNKIPELKKALAALKTAFLDPNMETKFELNETLFAKAKLSDVPEKRNKVCLWLGANLMVEYEVEEAQVLLEKKLNQAVSSMRIVEEDLDYLREQITTMEVNLARLYNEDVRQRKSVGKEK